MYDEFEKALAEALIEVWGTGAKKPPFKPEQLIAINTIKRAFAKMEEKK